MMESSAYTPKEKVTLPAEPYRGIKPFRYADRFIFAARDWEKEQLLNLILLYRGSLLYGESGVGKSSLINAGLIQLLEENNLQPEIIRVYPNLKETFRIYRIENSDKDNTYLPSIFDRVPSADQVSPVANDQASIGLSLEEFKEQVDKQKYSTKDNSERPIPVLLFDQFEELITLFEETGKIAVANDDIQLSERVIFQTDLINFLRECYYNSDLRIKLVFSFREDYLAKFSKLFRAIPQLRDHSLRIKTIDKDDIEEIIRCPFSDESRTANYPNAFSEAEIQLLTAKIKDYFEDADAVLTDVQIVCQYVYEKRNDLILTAVLEKEDSIDHIIQLFYAELLENLPPANKPLAIAILSLLVLNDNTRNIFHTDAIVEDLKDQYPAEEVIRVLKKLDDDTRLIKSELRAGSDKAYYEINSESLIPYINSLKQKRAKEIAEKKLQDDLKREQERARVLEIEKQEAVRKSGKFKKLLILIISLLLVAVIVVLIKQIYESKHSKSKGYLIAAKKADNPSLGYAIANIASARDRGYDQLREFSKQQGKSHRMLISNVLFHPWEVVAGFFKGEDTVGVIGKSSISYFDRKGLLLGQRFFKKIIYADTKQRYLINDLSNSLFSASASILDTAELCTFKGKVITKLVCGQNPGVFAIAPDAKTFIIDGSIYKTGILKFYQRIQVPVIGKRLISVLFTKDGKYIIAGCSSGLVVVYDLTGKRIKTFQDNRYSSVINSMALSNDGKFLILGGLDNTLCLLNFSESLLLPKTKEKNGITPVALAFLKEKGAGKINQITVSSNNQMFLSVGEDKTSRLWDFKGNMIEEMKGHKDAVVSGSFSRTDSCILTCTATGGIYIWGKMTSGENAPPPFSPLDYRLAEIEDYSVNDIYGKNASSSGLLSAIVNYTASLPQKIEDSTRYQVLKASVNELSALYNKEFQRFMFDGLTVLNKKMLISSYAAFKDDSLKLLDKTYILPVRDRDFVNMELQARSLLTDTANLQDAILYTYRFKNMATYYADDSPKDYGKSVLCLQHAIQISKAFLKKNGENDRLLKDFLAISYGNLSWYALFTKNYDLVISSANKGIGLGEKYDWIYTNLATGSLLTGNFQKAKNIYIRYKDSYKKDGSGFFRYSFLKDLDELTKAGIIDLNNKVLKGQVAEIRAILAGK